MDALIAGGPWLARTNITLQVSPTLWIDPDTIRVVVNDGVVTIEGQVERRSLIPVLDRLVLSTEGVIAFEHRLSYLTDDTSSPSDLPLPWTSIVPKVRS